VGFEEEEDDGEPFEVKMERLTGDLAVQFHKAESLQARIKESLELIGYDW
jgi:type I restriction enzyme M protein